MRRSKSTLPYQPVPISPTRFLGPASSAVNPGDFSTARPASPAALDCRNARRFNLALLVDSVFMLGNLSVGRRFMFVSGTIDVHGDCPTFRSRSTGRFLSGQVRGVTDYAERLDSPSL